MALVFLEDDPWLLEYESCERLCRDIMEQLSMRQKFPRTSDKYSHISANVRLRLKQFTNEVSQLNQKLDVTAKTESLTSAEWERRTRQVEFLLSKGIQMQKLFDDQVMSKLNEDRSQLIDRAGSSDWLSEENSRLSIDEIRTRQKQMIHKQNEGLENLSEIVLRQKDIANNISSEIDYHTEILDDLGTHIDRTDRNIHEATENVGVVLKKENTCVYWVIIVLLFISIVVVAII